MKINKRPERQKSKRTWQFFIFGCSCWAMCALLFLFSACGKSARKETDYPLPRHMQVMSMERAHNLYSEENLIINGDFTIWPEGSHAPEGFTAPKDRGVSVLVKLDPRGGPGENSVDQYFYKSDAGQSYFDFFHTRVANVNAGKIYEFFVHARSYENTSVSLSAVGVDSNGNPTTIWKNIITVAPGQGEFQEHKVRLSSSNSGPILLMAHTNENTTYRGRVVWLEWRLSEVMSIIKDGVIISDPL